MKTNKEKHLKLLWETLMDKEKRVGEMALSLSQDKDALEDAETELENAQKYLKNLKSQCANREKTRDVRAKMRADEITAISEAINILSDDDALDAFKQAKGGAAMLQVAYKPVEKKSHYMQVLEDGEPNGKTASMPDWAMPPKQVAFLQVVSSHRSARVEDSEA